jgi:hypothetical protein
MSRRGARPGGYRKPGERTHQLDVIRELWPGRTPVTLIGERLGISASQVSALAARSGLAKRVNRASKTKPLDT